MLLSNKMPAARYEAVCPDESQKMIGRPAVESTSADLEEKESDREKHNAQPTEHCGCCGCTLRIWLLLQLLVNGTLLIVVLALLSTHPRMERVNLSLLSVLSWLPARLRAPLATEFHTSATAPHTSVTGSTNSSSPFHLTLEDVLERHPAPFPIVSVNTPFDSPRKFVLKMELLEPRQDSSSGMNLSRTLFGTSHSGSTRSYEGRLLFHSYWRGPLQEKHIVSIISCFYHHMRGPHRLSTKRLIVLWTDQDGFHKTDPSLIEKLTELPNFEMRLLNLTLETLDGPLDHMDDSLSVRAAQSQGVQYSSDMLRCILLYNYGGVWYDADVFFLRPIDPVLLKWPTRVMLYRWEEQSYPNNAVFISLLPRSRALGDAIVFILKRGKGFGFQQAQLTFDQPLDLLILPCAWFDASWQPNALGFSSQNFFNARPASLTACTFNNFFPESFAYHWHNQWTTPIDQSSCIHDFQSEMQRTLDW